MWGLEGADDPLAGHGAGRRQQGVQLTGMVGIVIVYLGTAEAAPYTQTAVRAMKAVQASSGFSADAQHISRRSSGQGIGDVVLSATASAIWA